MTLSVFEYPQQMRRIRLDMAETQQYECIGYAACWHRIDVQKVSVRENIVLNIHRYLKIA